MTQQILDVPAIPLRDYVIFPSVLVPIYIGRKKSLEALQQFFKGVPYIFCINQKEMEIENPSREDLYSIGTLVRIRQFLELKDGSYKVLVEGVKRARLLNWTERDKRYSATVEDLEGEFFSLSSHDQALLKALRARVKDFSEKTKLFSKEMVEFFSKIRYPDVFCDFLAHHLPLRAVLKQEILDALDRTTRVEKTIVFLEKEAEWLRVEQRINARIKEKITEDQERYYKNQKLKAIQQELQDTSPEDDQSLAEYHGFLKKIKMLKLLKESEEKVLSELNKFKFMPAMSSEASVVRAYLEWVIALPWSKRASVSLDIPKAQARLDQDHFGLEKVKDRILQQLAVQKRKKHLSGPIICLLGPPGVGKTSLGKSVASAMGRPFVRISLGGVRDEAEIRGHRKTYVGSMPGRIIKALKRAGCKNPLILLDEIDKMGMDMRGDPASALLEVLDAEQNAQFVDHYLELDFDLSEVMFMTTANTADIPSALKDRLEMIELSGYTEYEKFRIAKDYLVPGVYEKCGIKPREFTISDALIKTLIRYYTYEAGVRGLSRAIQTLCQKFLLLSYQKPSFEKKNTPLRLTKKTLLKWLGPRLRDEPSNNEHARVGVINGLARTSVGGALLTIEATMVPGKGQLNYTGSLGDVMKESIRTAMTLVLTFSSVYDLDDALFSKNDCHVHVPEGATPKDGPSAGIGACCAILSTCAKLPIQSSIALTGEVTLSGKVLAIGGLKEKLLAATRDRMQMVIIPSANRRHLEDLPKEVTRGLKVHMVETISEVFALVFPSERAVSAT